MNEHDQRLADVEAFLRRMQPRAVNLTPPVAADEPLTLADRILVTIGSCGALAACIIVAIGFMNFSNAAPSSAPARPAWVDVEKMLAQY